MVAIVLNLLILTLCSFVWVVAKDYRVKFVLGCNFLWSSLILFNRLKLSELQLIWTLQEQFLISFLIFIPSMLAATFVVLSPKNNGSDAHLFDSKNELFVIQESKYFESACKKLTVVALVVLIVDLAINGVPLFSFGLGQALLNEARLEGRIPVLYNIAHAIFLCGALGLSIICFKYRKNKSFLIIVVLLYLVHCMLMVSRGSAMYILGGVVFSFLILSPTLIRYKIRNIILPIFVILLAFSTLGTLRQAEEGASERFSIIEYGHFTDATPEFVAWVYGYAVINFDNLIICIRDYDLEQEPRNKAILNFSPSFYLLVTGQDNGLVNMTDIQELPYVGRFNLPTAFGFFGFDGGWVAVYLYSLIVFFMLPIFFSGSYARMSSVRSIGYIYYGMSFLFITVSNMLFVSKIVGFVFGMILINMAVKRSIRKRAVP